MFRAALIPLLCLALLLPKATATLAFLLPGSFSTIVICTGTELRTISLDHQGQPVDSAEIHGLDCLSDAPGPNLGRLGINWQVLPRQFGSSFIRHEALMFTRAPEDTPSLGRAPPNPDTQVSLTSLA